MSLAEIAEVVGGAAHGGATVTGPAFVDSRVAEPGGLFVAVAGEHVDGHEYAVAAVAAGAAAVLGSRPVDAPCVVVDDAVTALGRLARHVVDGLPDTTVLALTGSQGKTGTKDYLAQILATAGPTVATAGNFNNEIGVPLTVLRATPETRFLVVEMGARGIGHIADLCEIAPPRIAAVTNVGTAHMSEFGTREAIAQAKGEILEALPEDGVAVLPGANPHRDPILAALRQRTKARIVTFGVLDAGDVYAFDLDTDALGRPTATLCWKDPERRARRPGEPPLCSRVGLQQLGMHQLDNAAAAAAMALEAGLDFDQVVAALGEARSLSRWRMEVHERADGVTVVNDAYNANPDSVGAALHWLGDVGRSAGRRTVAVLGEMKELGASHDAGHRQVGSAASRAADVLVVVGEPARGILDGFNAPDPLPIPESELAESDLPKPDRTAVFVEDRTEALAWLRENVAGGDVVLVKASRGAALEAVADGLVADRLEEGETD